MKLARVSVERPVLTAMLTLIVLVLGGVSLARLQIDLLPAVELPTVTVETEYAGASPEVMERLVTQIVEEIVATVPGVQELSSTSSEGSSRVQATFAFGADVDTAALDVRSKIEDESDELPDDIERLRVSKFDVSSFPVVILGVASDLDAVELTTLIDERVRHRFARIPGVAQVDPWGGYERELRVELDPQRLRALELPLDQILGALADANLDLPAGEIEQGRNSVTLRAPAEFSSPEQIADTIVAMRDGAPVRLAHIGEVHDTHRKLERLARIDGELGLRMGIRKQADANTVEVSEAILREVEAVNADFPRIHVVPIVNQGNFIERSIANVASSVLYGGALAIAVLLFFVRSLRSTAVIGISIPVSLVATFAVLYFSGLTLNLMTLGGLALGVGMMVDNSIVVLENVFRRRDELGESIVDAAIAGASEVGPAIVASTLTTLVIFLPLVFVGGVSGVLFRDLALVVAFSLTCSLLVALTLVPMLASRLLAGTTAPDQRPAWLTRVVVLSGEGLSRLTRHYSHALAWALRHRASTIGFAALGVLLSVALVPLIGTEFLPPSDEGEVRVTGEMEVGTKLEVLDRQTRALESLVLPRVPETTASVVSVGASGRNPGEAYQGELRLSLAPVAERARSNVEIADALRAEIEGRIPGMTVRTRAPQGQFLLERVLGGDEGLTVEVRGLDFDRLDALARRVAAIVTEVPGVTDVEVSRDAGVPEARLDIDRDKAASLGLSPRDIARALQTAVAGSEAGHYRVGESSYRILVRLADAEHRSLAEILDLTVTTPSGEAIPLRNVVTTHSGHGPMLIERKDQQRMIGVGANVAGRDLGGAATEIQGRLEQLATPDDYELRVAGRFEEQQEAFGELMVSLVLSLVLVYMVLAAQYESLRDPLVVMLSVPVAAIGVLVTLAATGTTLNVQSYIGCIMLGGIAVNNAILLVDQARRLCSDGMSNADAVREAGRRRLRPILMTTSTTVLALMPLAFGVGEGADAQAPLARAVLGGLTASTLISLVLVPIAFTLAHGERAHARRAAAGRPPG